jgi:iron complex transport system substrate-binding protein
VPIPAALVRIASLVPSATDVLLGAGLGDHLVAVSNYCRANPDAASVPSAGDYQTVDWERLAAVRPDVLLVFMSKDRIPTGMKDRATQLGIRIEVVKVETVADVLESITFFGELTHERHKAQLARDRLQQQLDTLRDRRQHGPRVKALLVVGDSARGVIGPGGFLDELLTLVGGDNAAKPLGSPYPSIDDEQLSAMDPDRIVHLLPGATPEQVEQVRAAWARRTGLRAAKEVTILTDWWLLQPGYRIGETARKLDAALHPLSQSPGEAPR